MVNREFLVPEKMQNRNQPVPKFNNRVIDGFLQISVKILI